MVLPACDPEACSSDPFTFKSDLSDPPPPPPHPLPPPRGGKGTPPPSTLFGQREFFLREVGICALRGQGGVLFQDGKDSTAREALPRQVAGQRRGALAVPAPGRFACGGEGGGRPPARAPPRRRRASPPASAARAPARSRGADTRAARAWP